ncbi:MAG: hypothetical protein QXS69_00800 [Candidatus Aenigmatarchaeota archaeon]
MAKIKFKRLRENLAIKRFFITLFLTVTISVFYFNLYKFLEKPSLNLVKKFEIANMFVWIDEKIRDNSYIYVERVFEYKINYPYVIKKPFYCYDLPENAIFHDKFGNVINVEKIENKVCISSEIKEFVVRITEKKDIKNYVVLSKIEDSNKIFIKNIDEFSLNFEIRIDIDKLIKSQGNVYRDGTLVSINSTYFFDSKVIAPYGNIEYEIKKS